MYNDSFIYYKIEIVRNFLNDWQGGYTINHIPWQKRQNTTQNDFISKQTVQFLVDTVLQASQYMKCKQLQYVLYGSYTY